MKHCTNIIFNIEEIRALQLGKVSMVHASCRLNKQLVRFCSRLLFFEGLKKVRHVADLFTSATAGIDDEAHAFLDRAATDVITKVLIEILRDTMETASLVFVRNIQEVQAPARLGLF